VKCVGDGIDEDPWQNNNLPRTFALLQNYPNPFNSSTTIRLRIPYDKSAMFAPRVKLEVFNILGQSVKVLKNEVMQPGNYAITWNGTDETGRAVASGIYFCKCSHVETADIIKMSLVK
jgi:flagellar hook assembly protein FlgD